MLGPVADVDGFRVVSAPCDAGHMFHEHCIGGWNSTSSRCPLCREDCLENPCVSVLGSILQALPDSKFSEAELYASLAKLKAVGGALKKEQRDAVKKLLADPKFCDRVSASPGFDK